MVALDAIIDNAVRFTGAGDPIELSVVRRGSEAAVTVTDSGPGIPEGQLESVFDRFEGAGPHAGNAHNFGLGLSIVRAVTEAHGGRATAARGSVGGAAVTMWLPLFQAAGLTGIEVRGPGPQPLAPRPPARHGHPGSPAPVPGVSG